MFIFIYSQPSSRSHKIRSVGQILEKLFDISLMKSSLNFVKLLISTESGLNWKLGQVNKIRGH